MHARYRIEWQFGVPDDGETIDMDPMSSVERVRSLEIAQEGNPVLAGVARPFDLPTEAEDARGVVSQVNPRSSDESTETAKQYEGNLSFFEVRGMAPGR